MRVVIIDVPLGSRSGYFTRQCVLETAPQRNCILLSTMLPRLRLIYLPMLLRVNCGLHRTVPLIHTLKKLFAVGVCCCRECCSTATRAFAISPPYIVPVPSGDVDFCDSQLQFLQAMKKSLTFSCRLIKTRQFLYFSHQGMYCYKSTLSRLHFKHSLRLYAVHEYK